MANGNAADNEEIWTLLGDEDKQSIWEETEAGFWPNWFQTHDETMAKLKDSYNKATTQTRVGLSKLAGERGQLVATQQRLIQDLNKIERDLKRVNDDTEKKTEALLHLEQEYRQDCAEELANHDTNSRKMRVFFNEKLGRPIDDDEVPVPRPQLTTREPEARRLTLPEPEPEPEHEPEYDPRAMEGIEFTSLSDAGSRPRGEVLVNVVDADHNVIGPVERIEPWNQWVQAVLKYPIQRSIVIRRGRRFNQHHLDTIYDRAEGKGVKWLSCMIQATGKIQSRRCLSCDKNQGAFESCVMVGGKLLHKCGNCEWNRQGCHGASNEFLPEPDNNATAAAYRVAEPTPEPARGLIADRTVDTGAGIEVDTAQARHNGNDGNTDMLDQVDGADNQELADSEGQADADTTVEMPSHDPDMTESEVGSPIAEPDHDVRETTAEKAKSISQILSANHESMREATKPGEHQNDQATKQPQEYGNKLEQPRAQEARPSVELDPRPYSGWSSTRPNNTQSVLQAPAATPPAKALHMPRDGPAVTSHPAQRREYNGPLSAPSSSAYPTTMGFTPANATIAFTPANLRSGPPSRQSSGPFGTPTIESAEPSPQPMQEDDEPLEDITKENLILRHNGEVYTYPECMEGVPLVKIDPSHPYWEPGWKDIRKEVEIQRAKWMAKLKDHRENPNPHKPGTSMKYQIGRQVNRGGTILDFLHSGPISPYQLLGKGYMHTPKGTQKGGITSYDTLFRMCESIQELAKFNLGISPVDWMRHRLWEISLETGKDFNCAKTLHDFYHDPKLLALRRRHGYKNIGRPSGQGKPLRPGTASNGTSTPLSHKRKGSHDSQTPSEARMPMALGDPMPASPSSGLVTNAISSLGNVTNSDAVNETNSNLVPAPKRHKSTSSFGEPTDIFATEDFSDCDSVSGASINREQYRISVIKHRQHTSSSDPSQYWLWQPDRLCFQHRVLKSTNPAEWRQLDKPVNFNLNIDEISEIVWNLTTLRILIKVNTESNRAVILDVDGKPRGDLMITFKRLRTMKRFMTFCRSMKVPLVKEEDR